MAPAEIPSSFVLSAALIVPGTDVVAATIEIVGVVVPLLTEIVPVPVTLVTVPGALELKVFQSAADK